MNPWIDCLWATHEAQDSHVPFTLWRAYEHVGGEYF